MISLNTGCVIGWNVADIETNTNLYLNLQITQTIQTEMI